MDPDDYESRNYHRPCPWTSCRCTHVGCIAGWLDRSDDQGERAIPCPTCRPEVSAHFHRHGASTRRLRAELPELPRPSRHARSDGSW